MRIIPILAAAAFLATSAAAQKAPPAMVSAPPTDMAFVELLDSRFGLFNAGADGKSFELTDTVPLKVGQSYGWFARLRLAMDRKQGKRRRGHHGVAEHGDQGAA